MGVDKACPVPVWRWPFRAGRGGMSDIGEQVQKIIVEHLGVYPDK